MDEILHKLMLLKYWNLIKIISNWQLSWKCQIYIYLLSPKFKKNCKISLEKAKMSDYKENALLHKT